MGDGALPEPRDLQCAPAHDPDYYREQAERAWRLSICISDRAARQALASLAQDFDDIADDLERGTAEVRHAELMPHIKS
jgi:hypothetical protein